MVKQGNGKKSKRGKDRPETEDGDGGDAEPGKSENWMDSAVGASALSQRRLVRAIPVGDSHVLLYAGSSKLIVANCGTGALVECEQPHTERVSAVAVSSEQKIAVTGGPDKKLVVWELPAMKIRTQVTTDKKIVALSLDNKCEQVVIADKAGEVFGKPLASLETPARHLLGHISSLTDMCLSPSGTRLLTADRDEKVRVSNYPYTSEIESVCLGHTEMVTCVEVFAGEAAKGDGDVILSGGADCTVRLWRMSDGKLLETVSFGEGEEEDNELVATDGKQGVLSEEAKETLKKAQLSNMHGKKTWDFMAAGTAEGTALVSRRYRGRNTSAPVVAIALCPATNTAAVALENFPSLILLRVDASAEHKLVKVGEVPLPDGRCPTGLALFTPQSGAASVLLVASTPYAPPKEEDPEDADDATKEVGADAPKKEVVEEPVAEAPKDPSGGGASAGGKMGLHALVFEADVEGGVRVVPVDKAAVPLSTPTLDAIAAMAGEVAKDESLPATGGRVDRVSQFMQKRRRHTEAGWKTLQGKS